VAAGVEHVAGEASTQRGLVGEGDWHKGTLSAAQGAGAALNGPVVGEDVPARWEYVRPGALRQARVVGVRHGDAPRVGAQGPCLECPAERVGGTVSRGGVGEGDLVEKHGALRL
jgi:hypothetical protein